MTLALSMSAAGESTSPREDPRVESPTPEEIDPESLGRIHNHPESGEEVTALICPGLSIVNRAGAW
jgi:hypothetical protein